VVELIERRHCQSAVKSGRVQLEKEKGKKRLREDKRDRGFRTKINVKTSFLGGSYQ